MRERGLKYGERMGRRTESGSLPMRERGLKFALGGPVRAGGLVAPHAGAWIEI